jgi:hypothetical protein
LRYKSPESAERLALIFGTDWNGDVKPEKSAGLIKQQLWGAKRDREQGRVKHIPVHELMAYRLAKRQRQVDGLKLELRDLAAEGSIFAEAVRYYSRMNYVPPGGAVVGG